MFLKGKFSRCNCAAVVVGPFSLPRPPVSELRPLTVTPGSEQPIRSPTRGGSLLRTPVTWQGWSQSLLSRRARPSCTRSRTHTSSHLWSQRKHTWTPDTVESGLRFAFHLFTCAVFFPFSFFLVFFFFLMNGLKGWDFWQLFMCRNTFMRYKHKEGELGSSKFLETQL